MIRFKTLFILILTVTYDYLFWQESFGINLLLFAFLAIPGLMAFNDFKIKNQNALITLAGTLFSALIVLIYNSGIAKFSYLISFTLMVGFIHQPGLQTIYNSVLNSLSEFIQVYKNFIEGYHKWKTGNARIHTIITYFNLSIIPVAVLLLFIWIFRAANPLFNDLSERFLSYAWSCVNYFFFELSWGRFLFVLVGLSVCSTIIFNRHIQLFLLKESRLTEKLIRTKSRRTNNGSPSIQFKSVFKKYKNEYWIAVIMILMLNGLFIVINIIDIQWIWFNFDYSQVNNLSQFVHEGTYLLILSILISIGIILHYFKGSMNFFSRNEFLKKNNLLMDSPKRSSVYFGLHTQLSLHTCARPCL